MVQTLTRLEELVVSISACRDACQPRRCIVALAGAPGSGKSTLAEALAEELAGAVVVPMDGFHLDDRLLEAVGKRAVKGAPDTFDVDGLVTLIERIARDDADVHIPVFDRDRELSRAAAATVATGDRVVLVEGNYLLLDQPGWRDLKPHFDMSVLIDVPEQILRDRLIARWLGQGLSSADAERKALGNDIPNGLLVQTASAGMDAIYKASTRV